MLKPTVCRLRVSEKITCQFNLSLSRQQTVANSTAARFPLMLPFLTAFSGQFCKFTVRESVFLTLIWHKAIFKIVIISLRSPPCVPAFSQLSPSSTCYGDRPSQPYLRSLRPWAISAIGPCAAGSLRLNAAPAIPTAAALQRLSPPGASRSDGRPSQCTGRASGTCCRAILIAAGSESRAGRHRLPAGLRMAGGTGEAAGGVSYG